MLIKTYLLFSLFCLPICAKPAQEISVTGSTTALPIIQEAAEIFEQESPEIKIALRGGGSRVGIASILDGTTDIAITSRKIKKDEEKVAIKKGILPVPNIIALDAVVVIIHPSNPLKNLAKHQLKDIFAGSIKTWDKVGGKTKKITLTSRDSPSGTFETFNMLVMGGVRITPDALMLMSNQNVLNAVSRSETAIGYISFGHLSPGVKPLKIENIAPLKENIQSGSYILSRNLYIYTNGKPKGPIKKFVDFLLGESGQKTVEKLGFVGIQ